MKGLSSRDVSIANIQKYLVDYKNIVNESFYIKALELKLESEWSMNYSLKDLFELEDFLRSYVTSQISYKEKLIMDLIQLGIHKKVYKLGPPYYVDISKDASYELQTEFTANEIIKMTKFIASVNKKSLVIKSKDELIDELLNEAKLNKLNEIHEPIYIDLIGYTKSDIKKFFSSEQLRLATENIRTKKKKKSISGELLEDTLKILEKRKEHLKPDETISHSSDETIILSSDETILLSSNETILLSSDETITLSSDETISFSDDESILFSNNEDLNTFIKETIVDEIFKYSNEKSIYTIDEPYYLNLEFDDRDDLLTNFSEKELRKILDLFKSAGEGIKKQENIINPLGILNMYEEGAIKVTPIADKEIWKKYIPSTLRYDLAGKSLEEAIKVMNEKIKKINRQNANYKEWMKFKQELEEILYEEDVIEEEQIDFEKEWEEDLEIALQIRKTVEAVILPHLEILQRLEENNGKLKLLDVNDQPFNENLKISVRERDNHSCIVCNGVSNLHVHHKIPRKLGGPNHIYNLVTLCSSCHSAIETADPLHAFTKGITNYFKNKNQKKYYEAES